MSRLDAAIFDLKLALSEKGISLEFIKVDAPLEHAGKTVSSIGGVDIRTIIYEDEATHWRTAAPKDNTQVIKKVKGE